MKHFILPITLVVLTFIVFTPRAYALFGHVAAEKERRHDAEQRIVQEQQNNGQLIQTNQGLHTILKDMVQDKTALEEAKDMGVHYHKARELRYKLADELAEFMGPDAVADSVKIPLWRAGVHAERERSACRQH